MMFATTAALALLQAAPISGDWYVYGADNVGTPSYVNVSTAFRSGEHAAATVVWPLRNRGFLEGRLEMDCSRMQYRTLSLISRDTDGSPKGPATNMDRGRDPSNYIGRDAEGLFRRICRDDLSGPKVTPRVWSDLH